MTNISSYVDYLPSVLWSQENDPSQFLGRMLRIFEKILTGVTIDARAVRATATIVNAVNKTIQVTDSADAAKFRAGDFITIEGTIERVQIDNILGAEIFLNANLTGSYNAGIIRTDDLIPGQTTFRVDNMAGLEPGSVIRITQGIKSEERTIQKLNDDFITLSAGLVNKYSMSITDVPVRIQDGISIVHSMYEYIDINSKAVRATATIVNAVNKTIQVTDSADAAKFRAGDFISIEGTTERVQIDNILGAETFLNTDLTGSYNAGIIRIDDLIPGQTTFRVDNMAGLEPGSVIKITQGIKSEERTIQKLNNDFIALSAGLVNKYSMSITDVPVTIQEIHEHVDFEKTIDELDRTFNPWRTRTDLLDWLASWVALTLKKDWSQYQKRKLISEIAYIYQQQGLKNGLYNYLDVYAATEAKPRIAIDDGGAILRATFLDNGTAILHTVAYSYAVSQQANVKTVLLHPSAIAVDSNNNYIIADQGDVGDVSLPQRNPRLWRMSSTGDIAYASTPSIPMPQPIPTDTQQSQAVVVDKLDRYNIVDVGAITSGNSKNSAIYRFTPPAYTQVTVIDKSTTPSFPAVHPVDMILNSSGNFVVLDLGIHVFGGSPTGDTNPQIIVVSEGPLTVTSHPLNPSDSEPKVIVPTALAMDSIGRFVIADAKDQSTSNPADLIRVDPAAGWSKTSLLGAVPANQNPLIFPIGLVFESPSSIIVCDSGVRAGSVDEEANRTMAEPAALYRIDISQTPPTITRITYDRKLVNPTKMVIDRKGKLIITDKGGSLQDGKQENWWRAKANEFGVVVLFSQQRPTSFDDRNRIRQEIKNVVDKQKPADTSWQEADHIYY